MKRWLSALLLLVFVTGVAGGLFYTWVLDPMEIYDTTPAALRVREKLIYLALVGDLYAQEEDLDRTRARLAELGLQPDGPVLADLIEAHLDGGGLPEEVRNLARLAEALGASGGVLALFAGPTPQPGPSVTALPAAETAASATPAPTPTPLPSFQLVEQTALCAVSGGPGLISVHVQDAAGQDLPGVEILVSWNGGQDRFWTGLRPAKGAGYADFQMAPDTAYDISLAAFRGDVARGLSSAVSQDLCPAGVTAVDWRLTFRQSP